MNHDPVQIGGKPPDMDVPALLLPYQQRWVADLSKVKVCEKSRRVGLSWADAAEAALTAASSKKAGGMNCYYIGYNKDMARQYISDTVFWAKSYGYAVGEMTEDEEIWYEGDERKSVFVYRVAFASGFAVEALSSKPRSLRSKQGRVTIDEAAFHDELAELLKAANALIMWGGRVAVVSTHDGVENLFNELVDSIKTGKSKYSLHRITIDDAIEEGLYKRICLVNDLEWSPEAESTWREELFEFYGNGSDEELLCIPRDSSGTYIPKVVLRAASDSEIPVLRISFDDVFVTEGDFYRRRIVDEWLEENLAPILCVLDPNLDSYLGEDFGRHGDLSVLNIGQEQKNLVLKTCFSVEMRKVPYKQQEQILYAICDNLPRFQHGCFDARGNGEYLAEVAAQRYGSSRITEVKITQAWYQTIMPRLKSGVEDKTLIIAGDADHLRDFALLEVNKGIAQISNSRRSSGTDGGQRHGDAVIAYAMLLQASQEDPIEYGYVPIGQGTKQNFMRTDHLDEAERQVNTGLRTGFRNMRGLY